MVQELLSVVDVALPPLHHTEPSIRLLKARSITSTSDQLSYNVETFSLSQCPPYKALSYTWGHPFPMGRVVMGNDVPFPPDEEYEARNIDWNKAQGNILCNGAAVQVVPNLLEALTQLSKDGEQGYLWVDRICIDQENPTERSRQVTLMHKIYRHADTVVVWLGRSGQDSLAALKVQENFAGPIYDLFIKGRLSEADLQSHTPNDPGDFQPGYLEAFGLQITSLETWFGWTQFFRRSWFYRRWTLQETALARHIDVLCGSQHLNWAKLKFLVRYFRISGWQAYLRRYMDTENCPSQAMLAREFVESVAANPHGWEKECIHCYGTYSIGTVLIEVLYRSCMLKCSDPADMIYAILGVIQSMPQTHEAASISVDYNGNFSDLYLTAARTCIETVPDLSILSLVQDSSRRAIAELPSWVPDIYGMASYVMMFRLGLDRRRPHGLLYNTAYQCQKIPVHRYVNDKVLHVKGYRLGDLVYCGIDLGAVDRDGEIQILSCLLDIWSLLPQTLRDGQDRIQALWRTIVADCEGIVRPASAELGECFHDWVLKHLIYHRCSSKAWPETLTGICERLAAVSETPTSHTLPAVGVGQLWWNRLHDMSSENAWEEARRFGLSSPRNTYQRFNMAGKIGARALFTTESGDVGFGPISGHPGDQVWVLENSRTPFVLRPTKDRLSFELLEECYVHGIMDGQLLSGGTLDYRPISIV